MDRAEQIEEMARDLCECYVDFDTGLIDIKATSVKLFAKGYRKASEVAREIFEEIENAHEECIHIDPSTDIGYLLQSKFELKLAELKKKYTEEGK